MLKIATVFSGIGAFEESLIKLGIDFETAFACDNGERLIEQSKEEILSYAMENNFKNKELNDYVNTLYEKIQKTDGISEKNKIFLIRLCKYLVEFYKL